MAEELFVIMHAPTVLGDAAVWWRPGRSGYTWSLDQAGRYTAEDAERIRMARHGDDVPVPLAVAERLAFRAVDHGQAIEAVGWQRGACRCDTCERLRAMAAQEEAAMREQPPRAESTCEWCRWWNADAEGCDLGQTAATCKGRHFEQEG